jgi:tetratricopeptide (TPR) repeat protein
MREAILLETHGRLHEALKVYKEALVLLRHSHGLELGRLHYRLSVLHWKRGCYEESLSHVDQALEFYHLNQKRAEAPDVADVFVAAGKTQLPVGSYLRSRKCFRHALSLLERQERSQQIIASAMHGLGMVYEAIGSNTKALKHFQIALSIQRYHIGINHKDTAATLLSVGSLLEKQGQCEHSLGCFDEAYRIYQQLAGVHSSPIDMGIALTHIGWIHYLRENHEESLACYHEALNLFKPLGSHRNVASAMTQIGMVYMRLSRYKRASRIYKKALKMQRSVLGANHEDVAITLTQLGSAMESLGRMQKALNFVDQAIQVRRQVYGERHLSLAEGLMKLGKLHACQGRSDAGIRCYSDALAVYRANQLRGCDPRVLCVQAALRDDPRFLRQQHESR